MAAAAPTAPRVPAARQSAIMKLLHGIGSALSDPQSAGILGLAEGLGAASAPHMLTPVSMGQAMSMGLQGAQQYRQASLANAIQQQAMLPYQVARTHEAQQAVSGQNNPSLSPLARAGDQALAANIISPGMGSTLYANNPAVVAQKTLAETLNQLQKIPANERAVLLAKAFNLPAQGALPEATQQTAAGGVAQMQGAPGAIASNAYNQAGGAAAGSYPVRAALSYHTKTPGHAGGTLGPPPGPFAPAQAAPGAANAARAAAIREQIGLMNGVSGAANAAGRPAPFAPTTPAAPSGGYSQPTPGGLAPPGTLAAERSAAQRQLPAVMAQLKAAQGAGVPGTGAARPVLTLPGARGAQPQGGGIFSAGMSPAQYAMSVGQGKQAVATNEGYQKQAEDAKDMLAQLESLDQSAHNFAPGQFADARIKGLQWMQSLGLITPAEMNRLGSAQEGAKMTIQLQSAFTRSLGSREAAQIFATLGRGVPNLTMSPDGFAKVSAYMAGMARYNMLRAEHAQNYFNAGNVKGVNNVRDQFLMHTNPAYFVIASAPPAVQREMVASMGAKARPFLHRWQKAINSGWAPEPDAYGATP